VIYENENSKTSYELLTTVFFLSGGLIVWAIITIRARLEHLMHPRLKMTLRWSEEVSWKSSQIWCHIQRSISLSQGATTFSITTLSIMDLILTLSIKVLGITIECYYTESLLLFVVMLSVIMPNVIMPNVVMLSVILLSVVAP
jgi:hypothetical protein